MEQISVIQQEIKDVFLGEPVMDYLLDIVRSTRSHPSVLLGASPRAAISFMMAVKAFAFLQERDYVLPDDVKTMAPYALAHRIVLRPEARLDSMSSGAALASILHQVRVPVTMGQ